MGRAGGGAHNPDFRDRCVDHALLSILCLQPFGDFEGTTEGADIFADAEDIGIALHFLEERLANRLEIGDFGHQRFSPPLPALQVPHPSARSFCSTAAVLPTRNQSGDSDAGSP